MPRYLDYRPGPAIHGGSLRDLASGNNVAALILANGQAQADAARRHGDIWGGAIDDIGHQIIGGLTQYGQQRDAEQIARATSAATADRYPSATKPGPPGSGVPIDPGSYQGPPGMTPEMSGRVPETGEDHLQSILNSISPENRPQVLAQVDQAKASAAKVKAQQVEFETKAQALAKAKSDFEQSTADHWYSVAMDAQDHLKDPDGGISAITVGGLVSAGVPGADQIKQFGIDGAKAFAAAQGDPAKQAQIVDAFRQQVTPLIQRGISGGSLAAQKSHAETRRALFEAQPKPKESKPVDLQEVDLNIRGKKVKGTFDKATGTYSYQGNAITNPQSWVEPKAPAGDKLVKVEHMDEASGKTVIEWLPQSEVRGQKFEKGLGATDQNRANMAETVNRTGQDIINKLSDPKFAAVVGPIMGRYGSLREFIGNPPPELAELAGEIESYSLASMGVHGMRNIKGSEKINSMLNGKHTPESIIAAIKGLNSFSSDYLKTVGRKPAAGKTAPADPLGIR